MCRYTVDVDSDNLKDRDEYPSYNGDRIIVNKFAYDISDPQRWDVVVFKYPENSKENYIKRLIGLPNERIWLHNGDVYVAPLGSQNYQIARKPPEKLRETLQPVYNNDYVVPKLIEAGMPPRWQPWAAAGNDQRVDNERRFQNVLRRWLPVGPRLASLSTFAARQRDLGRREARPAGSAAAAQSDPRFLCL